MTTCTLCGRAVAPALQFTEAVQAQIGADCCLSCAAGKLGRQLVREDFAPGAEADALNLRESPLLGSGEVRALIAARLGRASFSRAALHHWVSNGWLVPVEGAAKKMKIKVKLGSTVRRVEVIDSACRFRHCLRPHDVPVQGASGVRSSASRWCCLTNALHGCPDPLPEANKTPADAGKRDWNDHATGCPCAWCRVERDNAE